MDTLKAYYSLTKPGVLLGNALTAVAGFLLASRGHIDPGLFAALTIGTTLVIASACVLNNYLDQDIDSKMTRTKTRAIVTGKVSGRGALVFSIILGLAGVLILLKTNLLVVTIGIAGFVVYVWLYGATSKRRSIHGTLVGSISGAAPILAGYCAVSGQIDAGAILLFLIMFFWQFPEFYSISIYRREEYKAAGIPVISVVRGVKNTKIQILFYTFAFVITTVLLTLIGYTGYTYLVVVGAYGLYWLFIASRGLSAADSNRWARQVFHHSLIILLLFSLMISIDNLLP